MGFFEATMMCESVKCEKRFFVQQSVQHMKNFTTCHF